MKKTLLHIAIAVFITTQSYSSVKELLYKQLLQDTDSWKKIKEETSFEEFESIEHPQETITLSLETLKDDPYRNKINFDRPEDLLSLIQTENLTALQRMKELRLECSKTNSRYSMWKLLYVFNENDIIYECKIPSIGPYQPSYEITRLIKQEDGYLKITFKSQSTSMQHSSTHWLHQLKTLSLK